MSNNRLDLWLLCSLFSILSLSLCLPTVAITVYITNMIYKFSMEQHLAFILMVLLKRIQSLSWAINSFIMSLHVILNEASVAPLYLVSSAYRFRRRSLSIILLKNFSFMLLKFNVFNLISQYYAPPHFRILVKTVSHSFMLWNITLMMQRRVTFLCVAFV